MKKIGFRRKINIDWNNPFMVFFAIFTTIGILITTVLIVLSAWEEGWLAGAVFGGVGILLGIIGFIHQFLDSR